MAARAAQAQSGRRPREAVGGRLREGGSAAGRREGCGRPGVPTLTDRRRGSMAAATSLCSCFCWANGGAFMAETALLRRGRARGWQALVLWQQSLARRWFLGFGCGAFMPLSCCPTAPCRSGCGVKGRQAWLQPQPKVAVSCVELTIKPSEAPKWRQKLRSPRAEGQVAKKTPRLPSSASFFGCFSHLGEAALPPLATALQRPSKIEGR